MTDLPESLPEKNRDSSMDMDYHPRWVFVHEMRKMLDEFEDTDWIEPNQVRNLNVGRGDDNQIATIDLRWTRVEWWGKKE